MALIFNSLTLKSHRKDVWTFCCSWIRSRGFCRRWCRSLKLQENLWFGPLLENQIVLAFWILDALVLASLRIYEGSKWTMASIFLFPVRQARTDGLIVFVTARRIWCMEPLYQEKKKRSEKGCILNKGGGKWCEREAKWTFHAPSAGRIYWEKGGNPNCSTFLTPTPLHSEVLQVRRREHKETEKGILAAATCRIFPLAREKIGRNKTHTYKKTKKDLVT